METFAGRGFTEGDLKYVNWWVRNEVRIYFWSRMALYAANALVWAYVGWGLLDAYAISYPRESRLTLEIATNQNILNRIEQDRPTNLGTSQVLVFPTTEKRLDLMVDIQNPNTQWWPEFTYRFNVAGEETTARQGFILPDTLTTLTELGFTPKNASSRTGQLLVDNIRWHRVEPSQVNGDYNSFIANRFAGVTVQNVKFENVVGTGDQMTGHTTFDVVNRGAYGYWSIDYVIKLFRGSTVVGVNKVTVTDLKPDDTQHMDLLWYDRIPAVTKTDIQPVINLLDPNAFLPSSRLLAPTSTPQSLR